MTHEYRSGEEDIYIVIAPAVNGMVRFTIHRADTNEKMYGFMLPAEVARSTAEKLTLASFTAEDHRKWRDDQIQDME